MAVSINYDNAGGAKTPPKSQYSKFLQGDPTTTPKPAQKPVESVKGAQVVGITQVGEAVTHEVVHPGVVGTMKVGCGGSRTINLGNYESIKLSCWVEMPCDKATLGATWEFVSEWVGEKLAEAEQAVKGK